MEVNTQYILATGQIFAVTSGKFLSDAQVLDLAQKGIGVLRQELDAIPDLETKRVNPHTRIIEDCPVKLEQRRVSAIDSKLADLDVKKQRALFDGLRHGDWTWYDKHEEAAAALRAERAGK